MLKELILKLKEKVISFLILDSQELRGINAEDFIAVISTSGKGDITNNPNLGDELRIWKECQTNNIPILGICHGAQIGAYYSGGRISKLMVKRKSVFNDYQIKMSDPILLGVQNPVTYEDHEYAIDSVGSDWSTIMIDSLGKIQIARHKTFRMYIFQFHPEIIKPKTNAEHLLNNFLKIIREK